MNWLRFFVVLLSLFVSVATAEQKPESLFRIGYLSEDSDLRLSTTSMNNLRQTLLADEALMTLLKAEGFTGIGLYEADGSADLVPRLSAKEFHLAFCTTRNWVDVSGEYEAFLQTREEADILNSRTGFALRRGVIIVGPTHPMFQSVDVSQSATPGPVFPYIEAAGSKPFAVVQSQNLAGYVAPLLLLNSEGHSPTSTEFSENVLWCKSGDEVVKSVVSGLACMGACEERELLATLKAANLESQQNDLVRIIARTAPIPAHPVILRNDLTKKPELRQRLQSTLREFAREGGLEGLQLSPSTNADYAEAKLLMQRFQNVTFNTKPTP